MKGTSLDDIIVAISTPLGYGGIGIVRISGTDCILMADKLFRAKKNIVLSDKKSHTITYGVIIDPRDEQVIDEVLVTVMLAPNTYTRDDVVEINCHGGMLVVQKVLEICLNNGARLAEVGEFTKRAFLNGRLDLTQAEAVIDVINSKTDLSRQTAINQLEGRLKKEIKELRGEVLDIIASIEAVIDYPEHDIEEETYENTYEKSSSILKKINKMINSSYKGKIIRDGIETVILGKPNVGKSSLLNMFLNEERAIVTNVPGTTRDTVEEYINIEGIPVKIIDTAGIRNTSDIVEKIGVEKSKEYAKKADLILMMLDSSEKLEDDDIEILKLIINKKSLVLLNKTDLDMKINIDKIYEYIDKDNVISVSILKNEGIDLLIERLKKLFFNGEVELGQDVLLSNTRHINALNLAKDSLEKALATIEMRMPEDFISMDLQETLRYLGEITGDAIDEEIVDRIFTKFCLGK